MDLNKLQRMGRRRFMENLAGIGVSATTLDYLEQDELADITHNPEEEVPFIEGYRSTRNENGQVIDREPFYDTISREKWERQEATDDTLQKVGEMLQNYLEPNSNIILSRTIAEHSPTEYGVAVKVPRTSDSATRDEIEDLLPTNLSGGVEDGANAIEWAKIPVDVKEIEFENASGSVEQTCTASSTSSDDLPGGVPMYTSSGGSGTLSTPISDPDYGTCWVTAGHVVDENQKKIYLNINDSDLIGESRKYTLEKGEFLEFALVQPTSEETPAYAIASPDYSDFNDIPVDGMITDEALERHQGDTSYELATQGKSTGRMEGQYITDLNKPYDGDLGDTYAVQTSKTVEDGDSGGPLYKPAPDNTCGYALIAGNVNGRDTSNGGTFSTTAETIEDRTGGQF